MRWARAFTLIELLVVIAIIGILMGIAIPGARMVQRESQNSTCLSNLRQQFQAVDSYMIQNKDMLPMCEFIPVATDNGPEGGLPHLLKGHMPHDSEAWFCPCDFDEDSRSTGTSFIYAPGLLRYSPIVQGEVMGLIMAYPPGTMTQAQLDRIRLETEARLMTTFYRSNTEKYPLIVDSQDRHKRIDSMRNGVFLDGSARPANPPPEQDGEDGAP